MKQTEQQTGLMEQLNQELGLPYLVREILACPNALTDDMHLKLHDMLSDFQPDAALLAISSCAREIAWFYQNESSALHVMSIQAEQIAEEYGPSWLGHIAGDQNIDLTVIRSLLEQVPEDLEDMIELLGVAEGFFETRCRAAIDLCAILRIQAEAHKMVAEQVLDQIETEDLEADKTVMASPAVYENNIVQFPSLG